MKKADRKPKWFTKVRCTKAEMVLLGLVLFNIAILLWPLLKTGYPPTHDGEGHIARAANYAMAFRQGNIPPRWAPTFWNGFGYPIFNYYYPLLSILATPLIFAKLHPEVAVKLILGIAVVLTAGGLFWLLKRWGKAAGFFGVLAFLLSPYYFNLLFVRGAYGEVMAYLCLPWLVLAIEKIRNLNFKKASRIEIGWWLTVLVVATASLSLAHNITAMILIPAVFIFAVVRLYKKPNFLLSLLTMLVAMGITMFFWIPVLMEKGLTVLDEAVLREFPHHFPTLRQIVYSPVEQGFSIPGPNDSISLTPGVLMWAIVIVALMTVFQKKLSTTERSGLRSILLLWAVCLFFTLSVSFPLWKIIQPLQFMQFSWRFLGMMVFLGALLGAIIFERTPKQFQLRLVVIAIGLSVVRVGWPVNALLHHPGEYYFNHIQTTTVWDDARPQTFKVRQNHLSPQLPLIEGNAEVTVHDWKGVYRKYTVNAKEKVEITEPTAYFPGWEVEANGQKLELYPEEALGQIHYRLEPGEYRIRTRFTQNTFPRILGNTLTVLSGIFAIGLIGLVASKKLSLLSKFKN